MESAFLNPIFSNGLYAIQGKCSFGVIATITLEVFRNSRSWHNWHFSIT